MAALWLLGHQIVKRRFAILKSNLSDTYRSAFTAPTQDDDAPQLIALCIDLLRKEHSAVPFEDLSETELKMVLHAHAIDALPSWMSRYAAIWLSQSNKTLVLQLRQIKSSRPEQPKQHFGAVKQQQRLRSPVES